MKKENGKKAPARTAMLLLLALAMVLSSCLGWILEKPTFVLRGITLSPRSLLEMNLLVRLDVENPNRFDLTLTSFEYTVYLSNEEIGNGLIEQQLLIPASSTTSVQVPIAATFKNLGGSLKAIIAGNDVPYKIEGKADIKAIFGSLSFPFSKEGQINLKQ